MGDRRRNKPPENAWFKKGPQNHKPKPSPNEVPDKFKKASAQMLESASKYAQPIESSSDEDDLEEDNILESVMKDYSVLCVSSNSGKDLSLDKTREFLEQSFQSGAAICLICIASVKRIQPIWSCDLCYTALHLSCIQRWANGTIQYQMSESDPSLTDTIVRIKPNKKIEWCCPKCRASYSREQVPKVYTCFCKKKINPDYQPWLIPHSCGTTCDKSLNPDCGHRCLLLCHPGVCPPCPKIITIKCYCEKSAPRPIRCNVKGWSCNKVCNNVLSCKSHKCEKMCHVGDCSPCSKTSVQYCKCRKNKKIRPCASLEWQCDLKCNKEFECGYHSCEKVCHEGPCGNCPNTGAQKCPCGSVQKEVVCPEEVGTCGSTCNKTLPCDEHWCPNKCHKGPCDQCIKLVDKTCFCGLHVKQLPCHKQFFCETKCKIIKDCGRHACSKKCCNGNCLPCDKICGKTLQCKKHKCPNVCHRDFCYPCPLTSRISCKCGETGYTVPCGSERRNKPPKCNKNCKIPPSCDHVKENYHKCHFGQCPPCKQQCGKNLPCGHKCKALCHNAVPILLPSPKPAGPWEVQPPKVEIRTLPCPPCKEKVVRPCLGGHEQCEQLCVEARIAPCGRKCGRPLQCTNHYCSRECHPFEPVEDEYSKCEQCTRSCELPQPENCKHPCKKGCHPPPCNQCQQYVKKQCHCGLTELYIQCFVITLNQDLDNVMSCKQQCSHTLVCGHRCSIVCHPGACPNNCQKKTKVRCPCNRIKKDIPCNLVKTEEGIVLCDEICKEKKEIKNSLLAEAEMKRMQEEMAKNEKELLEYEKKFGKRRHREPRRRNGNSDTKQNNFYAKYVYISLALMGVLASIIFGYFASY